MNGPIDQAWIKRQVDLLLDAAKKLGPRSVMGRACLVRAEYYMDLVKAWRESPGDGREATVDRWQPIATLTADDGYVLVYRPRLEKPDRINIRRLGDWCGPKCCPSAEPTHWMPLPGEPSAAPVAAPTQEPEDGR